MNFSQSEAVSVKQPVRYTIPIADIKAHARNTIRVSEELTVVVLFDGQTMKVVHDLCPHMGGPLSQGTVCKKTGALVCPWHAYSFSAQNLTLVCNPNEKIWIEPLAGDQAETFKTPKYKLREIPFAREAGQIVIENLL